MSETKKQRVKDVVQSPMNELRYLVVLSCGHEQWETLKKRPKIGSVMRCRQLVCDR